MYAPFADYIHHAVISMFFAVRRGLAADQIETGVLRAGVIKATLTGGVHDAVLSMLLAERRLFAANGIVPKALRTGDM